MPRGDKSSYTSKQKRQAEHIEEGYERKGVSKKTAAKRAWATVNKQDGGGKKTPARKKSAKKKSATKSVLKTTRKKTTRRTTPSKKTVRSRR
ncbi:MAG: hypothetical protein ACREPX_00285 [Rhodanobacteraceae bacterium]